MPSPLLRLCASPQINARIVADVVKHLAPIGEVLFAATDPDLAATVKTMALHQSKLDLAFNTLGDALKAVSAGRAFRIEVMSDEQSDLPDDAHIKDLGKALESALSTTVFANRRTGSVQQWSREQPFPWGHRGPTIDRSVQRAGDSECLGVSVVFGPSTIIYKARLENMSDDGLKAACRAVGGPGAGFADVGAYPATSAADGCAVIVLEFASESRAPLPRVLDVLAIECARYGARLEKAALLSHVPLESLLGVLRSKTGLSAATSQIIETHLP